MGYKFLNAGATAELFIYNDIGWYGTSAAQFSQDLAAVGTKPLLVRISSNGGDPIDATAIYSLLASRKNTTTRVDGLAASAASIISQAGVPREIVSNGWLMIHEPVVIAAGNENAMRSAAESLSAVKAGMIQTYSKRSGKSPEEIKALMAAETWYTAEQAKANGFVDAVVDSLEVQAAVSFDPKALAGFKNIPPAVIAAFGTPPPVCGLPPQNLNNDFMGKISEFLNSFKAPAPGPTEREQKLIRLLAKADIDPEALITAEGDEGLHRLIEATVATGITAEKIQREKAEANFTKIVAALKTSGVEVNQEKLAELEAAIAARIETVASKKMVNMSASRGIPAIPTAPGAVNGATNGAPKTLTEQCLEAKAIAA